MCSGTLEDIFVLSEKSVKTWNGLADNQKQTGNYWGDSWQPGKTVFSLHLLLNPSIIFFSVSLCVYCCQKNKYTLYDERISNKLVIFFLCFHSLSSANFTFPYSAADHLKTTQNINLSSAINQKAQDRIIHGIFKCSLIHLLQ